MQPSGRSALLCRALHAAPRHRNAEAQRARSMCHAAHDAASRIAGMARCVGAMSPRRVAPCRVCGHYHVAGAKHRGCAPLLVRWFVVSHAGPTSELQIASVTGGTVATGQGPADVSGSRASDLRANSSGHFYLDREGEAEKRETRPQSLPLGVSGPETSGLEARPTS